MKLPDGISNWIKKWNDSNLCGEEKATLILTICISIMILLLCLSFIFKTKSNTIKKEVIPQTIGDTTYTIVIQDYQAKAIIEDLSETLLYFQKEGRKHGLELHLSKEQKKFIYVYKNQRTKRDSI